MLDETAKDSHQTTALISHDLMRNNELIFSSMRNLQFYVFKYWGVVFLDSGFVSPKNRYEINFFGQLGLYALYHCCLCVLFHSACAFLVTFHKGTFFTTLVILSVGTLSSGVRYAMLTRPKQLSIAANILSSVFLVVLGLVPSTIVAFVCFLWL